MVHRFEEEFANYVGAPFAVALNSCTAALHLSLLAAGISPGNEVVTTPLTSCAAAAVTNRTAERFNLHRGMFPNAEFISDRALSLPLSAATTDRDVDAIIGALADLLAGRSR